MNVHKRHSVPICSWHYNRISQSDKRGNIQVGVNREEAGQIRAAQTRAEWNSAYVHIYF